MLPQPLTRPLLLPRFASARSWGTLQGHAGGHAGGHAPGHAPVLNQRFKLAMHVRIAWTLMPWVSLPDIDLLAHAPESKDVIGQEGPVFNIRDH